MENKHSLSLGEEYPIYQTLTTENQNLIRNIDGKLLLTTMDYVEYIYEIVDLNNISESDKIAIFNELLLDLIPYFVTKGQNQDFRMSSEDQEKIIQSQIIIIINSLNLRKQETASHKNDIIETLAQTADPISGLDTNR